MRGVYGGNLRAPGIERCRLPSGSGGSGASFHVQKFRQDNLPHRTEPAVEFAFGIHAAGQMKKARSHCNGNMYSVEAKGVV